MTSPPLEPHTGIRGIARTVRELDDPGVEIVHLSPAEVARVTAKAARDYKRHVGGSRFEPDRGGPHASRVLQGEGAQFAVATWLGVSDLPKGVQVHRNHRVDGHLIVPGDALPGSWVLVTGALPDYGLVGWINRGEAADLGEWREDVPHAAWFVPQSALRPMPDLVVALAFGGAR